MHDVLFEVSLNLYILAVLLYLIHFNIIFPFASLVSEFKTTVFHIGYKW
jgi:hypothetical protein